MQTIFAIDGAEFGDLGAFSQALSRLQAWLVTLGQKTGDGTLQALVVDGLIGPRTQTATNLAFSKYFSGVGVGTLTQSQVAARADELANYVQAGIAKAYPSTAGVIATVAAKEEPKTTAMVPYVAPAAKATTIAPTYIPAPIDTSSGLQANIIKWSAIGLGLVVATAGIYYVIRKRGQPSMAGCLDGDAIHEDPRTKFWRSHRRMAAGNETFMHLVQTGLTREELEKLIAKRPGVYGRFSNWLNKLPSSSLGAGRRRATPKGPESAFNVTVWEERDRLHIGITKNGYPVDVDWWDDDARQMIEDGFFKTGRNLKSSVIEYAKDNGLIRVT
jgi:hypothetical protein